MATDDTGLPLPPPPAPKAPGLPRDPGVEAGIVKQSFEWTAGHTMDAVDPLAKWRDRLADATGRFGAPGVPGGLSGGGALDRLGTIGEKLFDGSAFEAVKAAASFLGQPIHTITHDYQVAKIEEMQDKFVADHRKELDTLNSAMGTLENRMLRLTYSADAAQKTAADSELAKRLVEQKAKLGDDVAGRIDDALAAASPEDAEKLRALKNDLDAWMRDRDSRVAPERKETAELYDRSNNLAAALRAQSGALAQASESAHYVKDGAHTRPQTVAYAAALRKLLVESRASVERALVR